MCDTFLMKYLCGHISYLYKALDHWGCMAKNTSLIIKPKKKESKNNLLEVSFSCLTIK